MKPKTKVHSEEDQQIMDEKEKHLDWTRKVTILSDSNS